MDLEGEPPVAAVHLAAGLVADPGGLVRPHQPRPHDLLAAREPLAQPRGQPADAEDVGEQAVADHCSRSHFYTRPDFLDACIHFSSDDPQCQY